MKNWVNRAFGLLKASHEQPRHELNELDWKGALSPDKKRLAEHLSAFSNYAGGGFMVYGVTNGGIPASVDQQTIEETVKQLANIGRHGIEPAISLDHAVGDYEGAKL